MRVTGIYTHNCALLLYILVSPIYCVRSFFIYLYVRASVTYVVISYIRGDCACELRAIYVYVCAAVSKVLILPSVVCSVAGPLNFN